MANESEENAKFNYYRDDLKKNNFFLQYGMFEEIFPTISLFKNKS